MNIQIKIYRPALLVGLALSIGSAFAQMPRATRLDSLLTSTDTVAVRTSLDQLFKSDKENDVNIAVQYYGRKNDVPDFERMRDIAIKRFPKGMLAYTKAANEAVAEKDPVKKERLVEALVQKYPGHDNAMYYFDVAETYADQTGKSANLLKVKTYSRKTTNLGFRSIVIETLLKEGHLDLAESLAQESMDTLKARIAALPARDTTTSQQSPFQMPGSNPKFEYNRYAMLYARILVKKGHPEEALSYAKEAYDKNPNRNYDLTSAYVEVLLANHRLAEAYPMMEKFYRLGMASAEMKAKLKDAYVSAKGSADGYEQLLASIRAQLRDSANARIVQFATVKSPAPGFTLKNIKGESVSLENLKGKVVILDFWATWCGPCKKSFPAMQLALNKYKDDPNVVFLFIDTWERVKDPLPGVKGYIDGNNYTFNVLLDQQDPVTSRNKVVESYKVTGIPTKFVIDRNGEIAFRLTGFSGGEDAAVEDLSAMIESAKGQAAGEKSIKVSGVLEYMGKGDGMVSLTYRKPGGGYLFDSCVVREGKFQFSKQWNEPIILVMSRKSPQGGRQGTLEDYRSFLLVPGEVNIVAHTKIADATVTGSGAIGDADYQEFIRKSDLYIDTMNNIARQTVRNISDPAEREKTGTRAMDSVGLRRAEQLYRRTIEEKPNSLVAVVALCSYAAEPVWRPRKKMAPEEIEALCSGLPKEFMTFPTLVSLKAELEVSKATEPGKPIIDFALKDTAGRTVRLSDLKGKYVFLDFWASWCAPCRKENPNVKSQFGKYKDKGFTVLSVSLDKPEARKVWIDAIRKDQIGLWTHVVDEDGFLGKVAKSYYVQSIPTNFLIGPDGKFINRNLYGENLDKELEQIFSGK